jgi:hypothetical protein
MCKNAEAQVLNAAEASESTILSLLTTANVINTAEGQKIDADFKTAIADIQAWKSGTPATDAEEVIQDIEAALPLIPIPVPFNVLVPIALGGLATVLTLLGANSPTSAPAVSENAEEVVAAQTIHAHTVAATGEAKVEALTGYKPSMIDKARAMLGDSSIAANKYKQVWNKTVEDNNLPESLKTA